MGIERIKEVNDFDTTELNACTYFNMIVDNYYIYIDSNFTEIEKEEEKLNLLKKLLKDEVKITSKKFINNGSKKLTKILNKVEEKTGN